MLKIIFILQDTPEFSEEMFWIFSGTEMTILALSAIGCIGGFVQVQKLSHSFQRPYDLGLFVNFHNENILYRKKFSFSDMSCLIIKVGSKKEFRVWQCRSVSDILSQTTTLILVQKKRGFIFQCHSFNEKIHITYVSSLYSMIFFFFQTNSQPMLPLWEPMFMPFSQ